MLTDAIGGLNLGLPGQYLDESGLWQNWHRYYDAQTGWYTQSDPIGLAGGVHTFAYVRGNPVQKIDPSGLGPETLDPGYDGSSRTAFPAYSPSWTFNSSPSAWSRLSPGQKFGVILAVGVTVGGAIGGVLGSAAGIADAGAANLLAGVIIPDAMFNGAVLGITVGGASATVVGSPVLFLDQPDPAVSGGAGLSCPIPK